jgi:hypothetical protein
MKVSELFEEVDSFVLTFGNDEGKPRIIRGDASTIVKKLISAFNRDVGLVSDAETSAKWKELKMKLAAEADPVKVLKALVKSDLAWDGYNIELIKNDKKVSSGGRHN